MDKVLLKLTPMGLPLPYNKVIGYGKEMLKIRATARVAPTKKILMASGFVGLTQIP